MKYRIGFEKQKSVHLSLLDHSRLAVLNVFGLVSH